MTGQGQKPLHVCQVVMTLNPAGAEYQLLEIIRNTRNNIRFTVCHFGLDDTLREDFLNAGARVINLGFQIPYDPFGIGRLVRYCHRNNVDLIHAHLPPAVIVGRLAGLVTSTPVVSTHHNVPENYQSFSRYCERVTRRFDERTIAVSDGVKHAHLEGEQNKRWITIYNGIDVDGFYSQVVSADIPPELENVRAEHEVVFLNIARYAPQKRQVDLITAFTNARSQLPSSHLFIVGWGDLETKLRQAAREKGVSSDITITGRVPKVEPYYATADLFISSSIREGLPVTFLEAMASELPILATDIPGVKEVVVEAETGLLVPPKKPRSLASGMVTLCEDHDLNKMGEMASERARNNFSVEKTVSDHLRVYYDIFDRQSNQT